jgi:hypothetical protein
VTRLLTPEALDVRQVLWRSFPRLLQMRQLPLLLLLLLLLLLFSFSLML